MIFYPFEGAYPSSAFGTATPTYDMAHIMFAYSDTNTCYRLGHSDDSF